MEETSLELANPESTRALGRALARAFGGAGCVLALEGPLGAGKTSLAKAYIEEATGTPEDDVPSPTFALVNEYRGEPGVLHLDAYRLGGAADLVALGLGDLDRTGRAVVIEWGSRVLAALPRERLEVELCHQEKGRRATLRASGPVASGALERVIQIVREELGTMGALKLALSGATGRMGRTVISLVREPGSGFELVQAIERSDSPDLGSEIVPGVRVATSLAAGAQVVIDFSSPEGTERRARECAPLGTALVACTTGLSEREEQALDAAAMKVPVLQAANTSLGVTLLQKITTEVARALGEDYDVEIVELHHNKKLDAPSGTALALARAVAEGGGKPALEGLVNGRSGKAPRRKGEIGVHALRLGDVVGEHRVYFAGAGERLELAHVASSRDTFARGALRAALWLSGKKPGRYTMAHVLGLA
ncbi:4-hydroxy-tetrahydrodipicolinate reductase [bacterium]|nr:4-hydroxy-tetrahydrodipicolinate reductase [bacterium]